MPLEYKDYAEIAVTRRLHRTGESEYLINKTHVRLRDVTDLFLGTGAGTKAYSIVEQGKVGLIVSAKPEDRRLLIEEAAGITKFKSRKKQAERKMELTQQNLLRVGDIVAEIDRSLASLERQAAKAERYVTYRNELEDLQLHEASHRYLELVGWIKLEGSARSSGFRRSTSVRRAISRRARASSRRSVWTCTRPRRRSTGRTTRASPRTAPCRPRRPRSSARRTASLRCASASRRPSPRSSEMVDQVARLAAERDAVARDVASLREDESLQAMRVAEEEAKLADLVATHGLCDARVAEGRHAIAKLQAEIASTEAKLAGFERRQGEMTARRDRLRAERESLEGGRAEQAARALELTRSIEDLRAGRVTTVADKGRLEQRLAELKAIIQRQEKALDESKGELSRKRSRHSALEEMHARLEGVGAGAKALVGTRDACLAGLVADRLEAPVELTQALAGLLGSRLQDVVVRDVDHATVLLEDLARGAGVEPRSCRTTPAMLRERAHCCRKTRPLWAVLRMVCASSRRTTPSSARSSATR